LSYQLITAATREPVSYEEAVAQIHGGVPADQAEFLQGLIAKARRFVERTTNRQLITATWRMWFDKFPTGADRTIRIDKVPVQSIVEIAYLDADGALTTLYDEDTETVPFRLDSVSEPARLLPAYGTTWPIAQAVVNAAYVEFTAGFGDDPADVPESIRHAILLLVSHWYEHREPLAEKVLNPIPFAVDSLLIAEEYGHYP
jgi:uncharacterized phiE125 gp8 family phage protein